MYLSQTFNAQVGQGFRFSHITIGIFSPVMILSFSEIMTINIGLQETVFKCLLAYRRYLNGHQRITVGEQME